MSSSNDKLVEIPKSDWTSLRDLYVVDWPKHHIAYNIIQNYIDWLERDPHIKNINVYSLNGDWSDGTFLIVDRFNVPFCSLNEKMDRLVRALDLLDKSKSYNLFGYVERVQPAVRTYFEMNNWNYTLDSETVWYFKPKEDVELFEIEVPAGLVLKSLAESDVELMNDLWPHKHDGSLETLKRLVKHNESLGVYNKETGELMAWCLRLILGSLGTLQVREEYKRQGLGSLLVKAMSKILADKGIDSTAPVIVKNSASRSMFKRLGFREVDKVIWNTTSSTDPNYKWNDEDDQ